MCKLTGSDVSELSLLALGLGKTVTAHVCSLDFRPMAAADQSSHSSGLVLSVIALF